MSRVDIIGLRKAFGAARALDTLNLEIEDGEFVVLLGPSGCGKTTALRCIAGLEYPDEGAIRIGGQEVVNPQTGRFVPANRRDIGMVFQSYALWPHMTVAANVGYPLKARGVARSAIRRDVDEILEVVGLGRFGARYPAELSGGQQQRVALARALVANPALVLFDEPLSNLDAQLRIRLRDEIRRIHIARRRTSIYVTHDQAEALTLADRIVLLNRGRIEQQGSPKDIFLSPKNRFVAEFVGITNFLPGTVTGATGSGLRFRPDNWSQDLQIHSSASIPVGMRATAAFRTSAATVSDGADTANTISARLIAAHYTGDKFDAHVAANGHDLTVSLPLSEGGALIQGNVTRHSTVQVRIPPSEILLLPDGQELTSPAAIAAE